MPMSMRSHQCYAGDLEIPTRVRPGAPEPGTATTCGPGASKSSRVWLRAGRTLAAGPGRAWRVPRIRRAPPLGDSVIPAATATSQGLLVEPEHPVDTCADGARVEADRTGPADLRRSVPGRPEIGQAAPEQHGSDTVLPLGLQRSHRPEPGAPVAAVTGERQVCALAGGDMAARWVMGHRELRLGRPGRDAPGAPAQPGGNVPGLG